MKLKPLISTSYYMEEAQPSRVIEKATVVGWLISLLNGLFHGPVLQYFIFIIYSICHTLPFNSVGRADTDLV